MMGRERKSSRAREVNVNPSRVHGRGTQETQKESPESKVKNLPERDEDSVIPLGKGGRKSLPRERKRIPTRGREEHSPRGREDNPPRGKEGE
jgi:hypothetical protein